MPQFLEFKLISGWPHDRYVPFLGEYLKFAESQPNKRKYQKWCRTKRLFDREALEFFNRLLGVRVGARKIQCDEIGEELLEELAKIKSDADLDYGPTMTDDGRRILAIDAETVSRARDSQDNSFLSSLFDRFVELNGYLARFIITEVGDGFLAENELMKRIQAGIYKGARPNVNQLKYWIEWMLILGIMIKVGFRFKLTARGLEQLEYLKNIPEAELLEAADEDDEEEDEDEDEDGEEDERPKSKSKASKAPEAPKAAARAAPKDEDEDDGDDLDDDDGPPAKAAKPKKAARSDDDDEDGDDDLDDEDEDALDEEGLEMPPEPGSIDHRGLDPREEALLATLDTAPAAVTGLKLALAPAMTALENLHSEIKEEIEAATTAARAAAEAAEERPRRKAKAAAKPAAGAKKRRSVVEIEDLGDAVAEAAQDFGDDDLDAEASAELEAPSDEVPTLAAEAAPSEPDFGQVIGRLRSLIRERSRPALDDALRVLQDAAAAAPSAQPGYAESPPPALAQNRERILRWWGNHPARAVFTAPELGIKAAPEGEETLFVLAAASEVLATPAAGAHKVAFFQKIHAAGLLGAYYRGESSLEDLLESCGLLSPETVGAPVFSALLALPKFRRACRRGALDAIRAAKTSREAVEALHKSLGARLGPGLIWLLREGRRLALLAPEDGARYEAVPDAEALETAYRLGFVSTHYSGGLDSLLQLSEKISLYFRQAEDGESPLALFAQAHGCRFHCPWTLRCPYACREKSLPPSFL